MNDDTVHIPAAGGRHTEVPVPDTFPEWDRTADRDALLAMTPRQHMIAAARIAIDTTFTSMDDVVLREARTQTHLLWAFTKMADDEVRRNA